MADVLERLKAALSDRYTIERELGSGGMATVYLAEDLKHHRQVAVKILSLPSSSWQCSLCGTPAVGFASRCRFSRSSLGPSLWARPPWQSMVFIF
jgi:hypothetical protein